MAEHAFFSLVPAVLRGLSDSVASVTTPKFAVRTRQRFFRGQMLAVHPAGEGKGALSQFDVIPLLYVLGTSRCHLSLCPLDRMDAAANSCRIGGPHLQYTLHLRRSFGLFQS